MTLTPADRKRDSHYRRTYGITLEQYNQMLENQGHKCWVCQRHQSEFKQRLHVDHNHATREVRGLLCNHCNRNVIGRHKDPELLRRAGDYLERAKTGWFVPVKKRKRHRRKKK